MAKIKAYKLVNVGALEASPFSTVRAAAAPIQAINSFGKTFTTIGNVFTDMHSIAKGTLAAYANIEQDQRRALRRQRDAEAEAKQERAARKNKSTRKKITKKKKKKLGIGDLFMKKLGEGLTRIVAPIFAPLTGWFGMIIGVLAARGVFDLLTDEEKRKKFVETFEKAKCVFGKIFNFIKDRVMNVWDGWQKLTGDDKSFIERLTGLGEILVGISGLLLAFNPLGILGFLFDTLAGIGNDPDAKKKKKADDPDSSKKKGTGADVDADGKPKQPTPDVDLDGPDGKPKGSTPSGAQPPKQKNFFQRFLDDKLAQADALRKKLMSEAASKFGLVDEWARKQYAGLSEAVRKQWENLTKLGSRIQKRATAIGSAIGNKVGDTAKYLKDGIGAMAAKAKAAVLEKILNPLGELLKPVTTRLKSMADKVLEPIFNSPLGKKVLEALKKKGVSGPSDFMGIAKRVGGKALPIVGGLVNLLFAYDRLANKDPVGALFEFLSAGFDIMGLIPGGQFGPPISMGIDAYMFARDLIPGIQEFEDGIIKKIPGADWVMNKIKAIPFPPLGDIIKAVTGGSIKLPGDDDLEEKASGGRLSARQRARRGGRHTRVTPAAAPAAAPEGDKKGVVALYAGHADMAEGAKGGRGTAGGRIVNGNQSSGLDGSPGGWVPAARDAGYQSNEAYFNDMIARKAAAKSGGIALYRKPIRTVSGGDKDSNWSRIDRDNADNITTIEIHQDAPPNMGRPGTMGIGPSMSDRGKTNSILAAVNSAYGIHTAQRSLGSVNPNDKSTLLEIDALKMEYLRNPGSFIERESTKLANAIKAGAAGYSRTVGPGAGAGDDPGVTGDMSSVSTDSGDTSTSTATPPKPPIVDPRETFANMVGSLLGDKNPLIDKPESEATLNNLAPVFDGQSESFFKMSQDVSFNKEFFEGTDVVPFIIDRAVPVSYAVPINTDTKFVYSIASSLLDKK